MPNPQSFRFTIAVTFVIAAALWPWPASAQVDQEITRSQSNTIQRAIENNLATTTAQRDQRRRSAATRQPQHPAGSEPTPAPAAPN